MKELLALDNFVTIPHGIIHQTKLLQKVNASGKYKFDASFKQEMKRIRNTRKNKHIFGSSEFVKPGKGQCDAWHEVMKVNSTQHWNLNIVVTYRRLHESLPSSWNQKFKKNRINSHVGPLRYRWPGINGETRIPTFEEWLPTEIPKGKHKMNHIAYDRYNGWKECTDRVTLLDYHNPEVLLDNGTVVDGDLMTSFVCNGIIGASHTCSHLVKPWMVNGLAQKGKGKSNGSASLDPGILADYAYEHGFIGKDFERPKVEEAIKKFIAGVGVTLPMKCPTSATLKHLYDHSLKGEKWAHSIISNARLEKQSGGGTPSLSTEQLHEFNLSWNRSLEEEKFCTVDCVEAMKRDEWKDFFEENYSGLNQTTG